MRRAVHVTSEIARCKTPVLAEVYGPGLQREGLEISADCFYYTFPSKKKKNGKKKTEELQRRAVNTPELSACLTGTDA